MGNNSAGGRSIRYGIMRDNVNSIDAITSNAELARFGMMPEHTFGLDEVLPELLNLGINNRFEIERRFIPGFPINFPTNVSAGSLYKLIGVST